MPEAREGFDPDELPPWETSGYGDPANNGEGLRDLLAGVRNGTWLDAQHFDPLEYHVPGIVPEGSTLLAGAPKIGKSWLVLSWALGIAHGGVVLGHLAVNPRPVLYLALEDGDRRLQDRCRKLLEGAPIPAAFDYLTRVEPGAILATIRAWLDSHKGWPGVVFIDTLGRCMPVARQGETAYQRDYRIGVGIKAAADDHAGSAIVTNHHDRKAGADDFVDSVSGTNGLAGSADTIIVVTRPRLETAGLIKVTGRDVAEGEYALRFEQGSRWQLDGSTLAEAAAKAGQARATAGLGDQSTAILAYVNLHPRGVTPAQIANALAIQPKVCHVYVRRLHDSGRIASPTRGLYVPVSSVTSLPSDDDESDQRK
jgi:hypothetical protein